MNIYLPAASFQVHANESRAKMPGESGVVSSFGSTRGAGAGFAPEVEQRVSPWKMWLEDYFPIEKVTFQGRIVKLQVGIVCVCFLCGQKGGSVS